ncbi:UTRA domain-containing protein [Streptomyces sp. NPDC001939]
MVQLQEVFVLNALRFENLQFSSPTDGDSYSNEVLHAGRVPRQEFRDQMVETPRDIASRLAVELDSAAVLHHCLRYVDDSPWSTQATHRPKWLADEHPRLADPRGIEESITRCLTDRGINQIGSTNDVETRMPTPNEVRELQMDPGVPVLIWTQTRYTADKSARCTGTTFRGDLNCVHFEQGDLRASAGADGELH